MYVVSYHSRQEIQKIDPTEFDRLNGAVLISIRDPGSPTPLLKTGWDHVRFFEFGDCDSDMEVLRKDAEGKPQTVVIPAMTEEQAGSMYRFVSIHRARRIYVHCEAGISRSAAVATFVQENFRYKLENRDRGIPNAHVHALLARVGRMSA